ncbi:helix-turn-helix DNA binding domain protein [Mycobacterium phage ThulaThula]|uniref:Helix-turn-helix DNA binding domain protein n=1 Tax=Mycobacterium phage ThulaThula TaxID=2599880 RepID=A0A5J6TFE5_9CAUD|nr:helix-turn-helix DNA binding domain protein [Mycobacterium phage ThulaThula]QFG09064.1 helix-turn-helix DNA binding domain protein [Mycobacterium phage ThulaThula]
MFPNVSCTMLDMTGMDWKRVGEHVVQRRTELGMRTTKAFAERVGLTPRMLGDLENGRRDNYAASTLASIEMALEWYPGSIKNIAKGGEPSPRASFAERHDRPAPAGALDDAISEAIRAVSGLSLAATNVRDTTLARQSAEFLVVLTDAHANSYNAQFGTTQKQPEGDQDDMETAAQPDASAEGHQDQEVELGGDEEVVRLPSSAESPPKPRRRKASEVQDRIPRPAKLGKRSKDASSFDQ